MSEVKMLLENKTPEPRTRMSALPYYEARLAQLRRDAARQERADTIIANLRLVLFLGGVVWASVAWWRDPVLLWGLMLPALCFALLMLLHERVLRARRRCRLLIAFYERGLARLTDTWQGRGDTGTEYLPPDHPCAADLDLFGQGSLFQLLSLARTRVGAATLARWLLTPATPDVVRLRQCAVEELRANTALREDLALYAQALAEDVDAASLSRWSQEPDIFPKPHFRHIARVLVILGAVAAILSYGADSIWPCIYVLTADVIVLGVAAGRLKRLGTALEEPRRELNVLGKVIARFQREPFQCPLLKALRERFYHEQMAASAALQRLDRLSYFFEMQANQLFAPFSIALLWGIHIAYRIEAWRKTWGAQLPQWLEAVGELEALASLACFAYERAEYVFPELREGGALFEADGLKHPLLPGATCVENSLHLDAAQPLLLVSGSNMSGKSTLLRTAGINTILAMAGAPVTARRLALGPLRAGATIAVHDSIQGGVSRFYAEIKRLKQLMDFAQDQDTRLLFLLDEILHGTNSHDRRIGAEAILTKLLERGAIGLVTTHDLAITGMGGAMVDKAVNAHFEDTVGEVGPVFDYRLKPGVVQRSNALALMRSVGLDV